MQAGALKEHGLWLWKTNQHISETFVIWGQEQRSDESGPECTSDAQRGCALPPRSHSQLVAGLSTGDWHPFLMQGIKEPLKNMYDLHKPGK